MTPAQKPMKTLFKLLLLFATGVVAQSTTARLKPVPADGLYKIAIPVDIRSHSKRDLGDFRILDERKREVPYSRLAQASGGLEICYEFVPFKIVSNTAIPGKKSIVTVENGVGEITDVSLKIANIEVTKKFSLSGSDDGKNWYGIIDRKTFTDVKSQVSFADYRTIAMPITKYRFLRFDFDDTKTLPVNIIEVGFNRQKPCPDAIVFDTIQNAAIEINDVANTKKTRIRIRFSQPQAINRIAMGTTSPKNFERQASVYILEPRKVKRRTQVFQQELDRFTIHPQLIDHEFDLFGREFFIEIDNRDSPPLEISKLVLLQQRQYIAAELVKGQEYTVTTGDLKEYAPDYDIAGAISLKSRNKDLPQTSIVSISHEKPKTSQQEAGTPIPLWQQSWFLWVCICIATAGVGYFTWSLVKDMK